jgi:hypothetical protein
MSTSPMRDCLVYRDGDKWLAAVDLTSSGFHTPYILNQKGVDGSKV